MIWAALLSSMTGKEKRRQRIVFFRGWWGLPSRRKAAKVREGEKREKKRIDLNRLCDKKGGKENTALRPLRHVGTSDAICVGKRGRKKGERRSLGILKGKRKGRLITSLPPDREFPRNKHGR